MSLDEITKYITKPEKRLCHCKDCLGFHIFNVKETKNNWKGRVRRVYIEKEKQVECGFLKTQSSLLSEI